MDWVRLSCGVAETAAFILGSMESLLRKMNREVGTASKEQGSRSRQLLVQEDIPPRHYYR